jgi:hypothetical protein
MATKAVRRKADSSIEKNDNMDSSAPKRDPRCKRRYPRYSLDVRMLVHIFRAGVTTTIWGRSTMIGKEGIGGTLTGDLEMGEVVGLEFTVPLFQHPVKLRAIVRYKNGFQYGFEFLAVDAMQKQALERACEILPLTS